MLAFCGRAQKLRGAAAAAADTTLSPIGVLRCDEVSSGSTVKPILTSPIGSTRESAPPSPAPCDRLEPSAQGATVCGLRCITASVERVAQRSSIHSIVCSDGDDPAAWLPAIPLIPYGDIHSLSDNLKDDASARFFSGMNHAFASVNAGREPARGFPQCFQGQRLFRFVAPRPEDLRVVVQMAINVMPTIGIVTVGMMAGLLVWRCGIESGRIEPADRQQDFQRHISAGCLDEPIAMEPVVEPCFDPLDLLRGDEIDLVEDEHVCECHLAKLQFHHLRCREDLLRIHDAHDAVQPDAVAHGRRP